MVNIIIVAAGSGSRFGADLPKQFVTLGEVPVLMHTLVRLARAVPRARVIVALSQEYTDFWARACAMHGFTSPEVVIGGDTRWQSVRNAVMAIPPHLSTAADVTLVHDGARPSLKSDMVRRVVAAVEGGAEAAIPVVPVTDSIRALGPDGSSTPIDRSALVAVQTPQGFRADILRQAYEMPYQDGFTDDASVYQTFTGRAPMLVEGSPTNIKITTPRDIDIAALYMGITNG